jgi:hypothetical protein
MATVAEGLKTQLANIEKTYGRSIEELTTEIADSGLTKHRDVVAMLKERHGMNHAAAHRVSLTARERLGQGSASGSSSAPPATRDVYDRLLALVTSLGPDVERAPKKGYLSLRRRKQFAMLQPGAKSVSVGLVLRGEEPTARLESAAKWNALFTHRVRVATPADINGELKAWLEAAYTAAG